MFTHFLISAQTFSWDVCWHLVHKQSLQTHNLRTCMNKVQNEFQKTVLFNFPPICPLHRKPDLGDFQQLEFKVWESIRFSELSINFPCFSLRTTVFQFLLSSRLGYLWYSSCKRLWERILTRFVCSPPTALFSHLLPLKAIEIIEMYFKKVFKRKCNIHQLVKENVILIN